MAFLLYRGIDLTSSGKLGEATSGISVGEGGDEYSDEVAE